MKSKNEQEKEHKRQLDAIIAADKDPNANIRCPACNSGILKAETLYAGVDGGERRVFCPSCGVQSFLRVSPEHHSQQNRKDDPNNHGD